MLHIELMFENEMVSRMLAIWDQAILLSWANV